jgi:hypothetical protein
MELFIGGDQAAHFLHAILRSHCAAAEPSLDKRSASARIKSASSSGKAIDGYLVLP